MTQGLDAAGVAWERNARLVRGLDYYRHTAFEFVTDRLGAQGTVLGGGRYDGLIETLGGPPTPAVGWAAGIERLGMLVGEVSISRPDIVVVLDHDSWAKASFGVVAQLRSQALLTEFISTGSVNKRFDKAQKLNPRTILLLGYKADGMEASLRFFDQSDEADRINDIVRNKVLPNFVGLI